MKLSRLTAFALLWLAGCVLSQAQNRDNSWELGVFAAHHDFDSEVELDDESGTGFRIGYNIRAVHEIEFSMDQVDTQDIFVDDIDFEISKWQLNYLYNFVMGRGQPVVPYVTGGIGSLSLEENNPVFGRFEETNELFNMGVGVRFFVGEHFNIRLDLRSIFYEGDNEILFNDEFQNTEYSVGLGWILGG